MGTCTFAQVPVPIEKSITKMFNKDDMFFERRVLSCYILAWILVLQR